MAAELAKAVAGNLLIATVADSQLTEEAWQLARVEGNIGDVLEALTTKTLKDAEARARRLGISGIELRTGSGDVAQSLIDIAAGNLVEMIVLGRRGRGVSRAVARQRLPEACQPRALCRRRRSLKAKPCVGS